MYDNFFSLQSYFSYEIMVKVISCKLYVGPLNSSPNFIGSWNRHCSAMRFQRQHECVTLQQVYTLAGETRLTVILRHVVIIYTL